jgi:hypothetical protein
MKLTRSIKYLIGVAPFILPILGSVAHAGEVVIHAGSYHTMHRDALLDGGSLNEVNPGIGYRKDGYEIGIYKNSMSKPSVYLFKEWYTIIFNMEAGAFVGMVTGYNLPNISSNQMINMWASMAPVVYPATGLYVRKDNFRLSLIPGGTESGEVVPVVALSLIF